MTEDTNNEVVTNIQILKLCRFYQLFDPKIKKVLGWNVYQLFITVYTVIVLCLLLYGTIGFFFDHDNSTKLTEYIRLSASLIIIYLSIFKMTVFLYNADPIWKMFDVMRLDFLKSKLCRNNIDMLHKSCDRAKTLTNLYFYVTLFAILQWNLFPLVINMFTKHEDYKRMTNIINIRFPVTVQTHNDNYFLFYTLESIIVYYLMYAVLSSNAFFMCFCWVIIAQHDVLAETYRNIGYKNKIQNLYNDIEYIDDYTNFKSIIFDQQRLNRKLKSYYSIVWPIIIVYIACTSVFITILILVFILDFSSETSSGLNIFMVGSSALNVSFELYIHCYLFGSLNFKKELVNFGIYSCNWTNMNLKTRKLILLTMRMNNANTLMIKASPKKIIDLNIFVNVMTTSYNILSVMMKALNKENKY